MIKPLLTLLTFAALTACSAAPTQSANEAKTGPWDLKAAQSQIQYITIKNGDIAESNHFTLFSGKVDAAGTAQIDIALNSVETFVDTRNSRMKEFVFKTEQYPSATIKAALPMDNFKGYALGTRQKFETDITVSMAGQAQDYSAEFMITPISANKVLVESAAPIMVEAGDFAFEAGIAKLQSLANLQAITPIVPVSFSLIFER